MIPMVVERIPASSDGKIIADAFFDPALVIIPMIEVGKSCRLVQERIISMVIGYDTSPDGLSSFMLSMALIPIGIAAPPIPSILAEI